MTDPTEQLLQQALQDLYLVYETGLNNLHNALLSLAQACEESDGSMKRALTSMDERIDRLEYQHRAMALLLSKKHP